MIPILLGPMIRFRTLAIAGGLLMSVETSAAADSLSQYGITWRFSEDKHVGRFCNGDWWVVGPVTISDIAPKTTGGDFGNGSMINPIPGQSQGFYSETKYPAYSAAKDMSLRIPFTIPAGSSLVSTIRNPDTWASNSSPGALVEKTWFKETAVLTVLSSPPPEGSFRPPYAGSDKTIRANWNRSALQYGKLRRLAAPVAAHVPDRGWLEEATRRPLLEMHPNYLNSNWKASWNPDKPGGYPRRTYGREISHISGAAGLLLQTDLPDATKEKLLIHMCQWGIDIEGLLRAGMQWQPNGGHNHGRLLPLYLAAKVLEDPDMLSLCRPSKAVFQEFAQHWYVTQSEIDTPRANPATMEPYTQDMLGMPEWSSGGPGERNQASAQFFGGTGYRFINGGPNCAVVATILLMGGRSEVSCEPFIDYIATRHYPMTKSGAAHTIPNYGDVPSLFTRDIWDAYLPGSAGPVEIEFAIGNRIECPDGADVRADSSLASSLLGRQPKAATGLIVGGPVKADGIVWWDVNFDSGADGWTDGAGLLLRAAAATPPSKPASPTVTSE